MKARINDQRINDTSLCEVFTYAEEEKETTLIFDHKNKIWNVWTSVPTHITKLLKLKDNNFKVDSVTEVGTITAIKGTLLPKQISFKKIIELSEERKEKLKEHIKRLQNK